MMRYFSCFTGITEFVNMLHYFFMEFMRSFQTSAGGTGWSLSLPPLHSKFLPFWRHFWACLWHWQFIRQLKNLFVPLVLEVFCTIWYSRQVVNQASGAIKLFQIYKILTFTLIVQDTSWFLYGRVGTCPQRVFSVDETSHEFRAV